MQGSPRARGCVSHLARCRTPAGRCSLRSTRTRLQLLAEAKTLRLPDQLPKSCRSAINRVPRRRADPKVCRFAGTSDGARGTRTPDLLGAMAN
jgi:hypothetical protein